MTKKLTVEDLKNSHNTMMKFLFMKKTPTMEDLEECRQFYKETSKGKHKPGPARFKKLYKEELEVYNNRIKS